MEAEEVKVAAKVNEVEERGGGGGGEGGRERWRQRWRQR